MVSKKLTMCSASFFEYLEHMLHKLFAEVVYCEMHISQQHGHYKFFFNSPNLYRSKERNICHRIRFGILLFHKASQDGADRHAERQLAGRVRVPVKVTQSIAIESIGFDRSAGPSWAITESSLATVGPSLAIIESSLAAVGP